MTSQEEVGVAPAVGREAQGVVPVRRHGLVGRVQDLAHPLGAQAQDGGVEGAELVPAHHPRSALVDDVEHDAGEVLQPHGELVEGFGLVQDGSPAGQPLVQAAHPLPLAGGAHHDAVLGPPGGGRRARVVVSPLGLQEGADEVVLHLAQDVVLGGVVGPVSEVPQPLAQVLEVLPRDDVVAVAVEEVGEELRELLSLDGRQERGRVLHLLV